MKRRIRTQPSNPYYTNEPAVARGLIADQGITQNASLGNQPPKMVDKKPGKASGLAGFVSKSRPPHKASGISQPPLGTANKYPAQGKLRNSGNPKAHRLGSIKLKV